MDTKESDGWVVRPTHSIITVAPPGFPDAVTFPNAAVIRNECSVATGWVTDPTTLPGGLNSATKFRLRTTQPVPAAGSFGFSMNLQVLGTNPFTGVAWPLNTVLPDWAAFRTDEFTPAWNSNSYNPQTTPAIAHTGVPTGDRAILTRGLARINKVTLNLDGVTPDDSVNSVVAGSQVGFALLPSLNGAAGVSATADVTVYDILPLGMTYAGGSSTVNGVAVPPVAQV